MSVQSETSGVGYVVWVDFVWVGALGSFTKEALSPLSFMSSGFRAWGFYLLKELSEMWDVSVKSNWYSALSPYWY